MVAGVVRPSIQPQIYYEIEQFIVSMGLVRTFWWRCFETFDIGCIREVAQVT